MPDADLRGLAPSEYLSALVYELLDAHEDTMRLADELCEEERWAAHVDYLRDLQRVGRERLARVGAVAAER
ncbi:MAG: hypothetical protein ACJ764_04425 [Solirubrobacteraceae bacterium]